MSTHKKTLPGAADDEEASAVSAFVGGIEDIEDAPHAIDSESSKLWGGSGKAHALTIKPRLQRRSSVGIMKLSTKGGGGVEETEEASQHDHESNTDGLVYFSRESLLERMAKEDCDRIRQMSEWAYNVAAFLTYRPVMQLWYCLSIAFCVAFGIASNWNYFFVIVCFFNIIPLLYARLVTNNFFGHVVELRNPFASSFYQKPTIVQPEKQEETSHRQFCSWSCLNKSEAEINHKSTKPTKLASSSGCCGGATSAEAHVNAATEADASTSVFMLIMAEQKGDDKSTPSSMDVSVYRLMNAIISFNIKTRDSTRWSAKENMKVPLLYEERIWRDVESKTDMGFFKSVVFLIPLAFVIAIIVQFFQNFLMWTVIPIAQGSFVSIWIFINVVGYFYWPYLIGCIVGIFSTFVLTMHVHHFQLTLLKARLEFDRIHNEDVVPQWKSLRLLIEEYLFHQFTIKRTAEAWQLIVVVCELGLIIYSAVAIAAFIMFHDENIFGVGIIAACVFLLVLYLIAKLNGELSAIREILVCGSSEDWKLYHGRDELIKYLDSNPTQFCIFGFAITFKFLVGIATSIISANIGALLAVLGLQKSTSTVAGQPPTK